MKLDVDVRGADAVARFMRDIYRDQLPFATSLAINETAKDFQAEQRRGMHRRFTLRRVRFAERAVKIRRSDFATKRKLEARVRIDAPRGRSDIFAKFEEGGTKRPQGQRLAVPDEARRTKAGVISKTHRPRNLDFRPHGRGKVFARKTNVMVGKKRTFLVRKPGGRGAIFQRTGRGRGSRVRVLFTFTPRARIRPQLRFHETAQRVVRKRFDHNFEKAFRRAIATAR